MLTEARGLCPLSELEFELRLGRVVRDHRGRQRFDSSVGPSTFTLIQQTLDKSAAWVKVANSHVTDRFARKGGQRVSYDHDRALYSAVQKTKLRSLDVECPAACADIRCAVAREQKVWTSEQAPEIDFVFARDKVRTRYEYRHFAFDLTRVHRDASQNEDSDEPDVYEIEIELIDPTALERLPVRYVVEHALLLCSDMLQMAMKAQ